MSREPATGAGGPQPWPLPWTRLQIEAILPHRDPFLLVDRVETLESEQRIVGIRTWPSADARVLTPQGDMAVPAAYLTECMAQVGAILVLVRPENQGRLIYFGRIDRVRFRAAVRPGDSLRVEATVRRLRRQFGTLHGHATVGGRPVAEGTMTFSLSPGDAGPG